jgi:hypothetical protein
MRKLIVLTLLLALGGIEGAAQTEHLWVGMDDDVLPQVADGGGWKTSITLVNMDTEPAQYTLEFFRNGGSPLVLDFVSIGRGSIVSGTLPVNGSVVIETLGTAQTNSQGFALLDSPNFKDVNGYGIFRQQVAGRPDFEAVTPFSSMFDDDFILPFDNSGGFTTAMAICNPDSYTSATVTVAFYDQLGNRTYLDQFTLMPLEQAAFALPVRWPATANKRGTAVFQVSGWGAPALGLRFNDSGAFTSTHTLSR